MQCYDGMAQARQAQAQIRRLREQLRGVREKAGEGAVAEAAAALDRKAAALAGAERPAMRGRGRGNTEGESLGRFGGELGRLLAVLQGADAAPTTQTVAAVGAARQALDGLLKRWADVQAKDVPALNEQLRQGGLAPVDLGPSSAGAGRQP